MSIRKDTKGSRKRQGPINTLSNTGYCVFQAASSRLLYEDRKGQGTILSHSFEGLVRDLVCP
jgi:hypothetical protein